MLNPPAASDESPTEQNSKQKDMEDERERVIAAYRSFKKIRRQHQRQAAAEADNDNDDADSDGGGGGGGFHTL